MACESVIENSTPDVQESSSNHYATGYQRVSSHFFLSSDDLCLTISDGKMRFTTVCLRKFDDVEYVELLINTVNNCLAIRPCEKDNLNAIHWGRLKNEKWIFTIMSALAQEESRSISENIRWSLQKKFQNG